MSDIKDRIVEVLREQRYAPDASCERCRLKMVPDWSDVAHVADVLAEQLHEARVIRTAEQLDTLPFLALVREIRPSPGSGTDYGAVWERRTSSWHAIAGTLMPPGHRTPRLPALVLWNPDETGGAR